MLPATIWGFLTAVLIVLVGGFLLFPDSFYWRVPIASGSTTSTTLLCTGGSGAPCCRKDDRSEHTSGLAITIDRPHNNVNVFLEGEGSANGAIIEDEESHLLFGEISCDETSFAGTDTCKVASGEINRLTGVGNIAIKDGNGQTVIEWNKLECKPRGRRF
jgi:hypothetical protein